MSTPHNTRLRSRQPTPSGSSALPALDAKASHSYGARGKATLHSQVAAQSTGLTEAFQGASTARRSTRANSKAASVASQEPEGEDEDEPEEDAIKVDRPSKRAATPVARKARQAPPSTLKGARSLNAVGEDEEYEEEDDDGESSGRLTPGSDEEEEARPLRKGKQNVTAPPARIQQQARPLAPKPQPAFPRAAPRINATPLVNNSVVDRIGTVMGEVPGYNGLMEPSAVQVTAQTIPRYIPQVLKDSTQFFTVFGKIVTAMLLFTIFITGLLALMPGVGAAIGPIAEPFVTSWWHFRRGPVPYDVPAEQLREEWLEFKHWHVAHAESHDVRVKNFTQWQINLGFWARIRNLEDDVRAMQKEVTLHQETLDYFNHTLPNVMVVGVADNEWVLSETFWKAFQAKVSDPQDSQHLWQNFLTANKRMVDQVNKDGSDSAVSGRYVVDKTILNEEIQKAYGRLQRENKEALQQHERDFLARMRPEIAAITKDETEKSSARVFARMQARSIAAATLSLNIAEAMSQTNWFSPGMGARINPYLTSPTRDLRLRPWFSRTLLHGQNPRAPIDALTHWQEATECWCAAPNAPGQGKTQIGIHLPQKIFPERFVVEHVPARGTIDIAAAPRELEFWVDVGSAAAASQLRAWISEAPLVDRYECDDAFAPSPSYVCAAKGVYDIHDANWVQSFRLAVDARATGMAVESVVVRVVSNWGAPHTCLYRLRLVGERLDDGLPGMAAP